MGKGFVRVKGSFDKILDRAEDGSVRVLMKNEDTNNRLKSSVVMIRFTKKQWEKLKDIKTPLEEELFLVEGNFETRINKKYKPFLYVECSQLSRKKRTKGRKGGSKMIPYELNSFEGNWFNKVPSEELIEIDITKVKLSEEIHLNAIIDNFNIKEMLEMSEFRPIAVRKCDCTYTLISGLRTYIVAKLFSRNIKAYITDLDIHEFREKYLLE